MLQYILKRLLNMIPLLLGISLISFWIMQLAPGDYFSTMELNPEISRETLNQMREEFHLEKPAFFVAVDVEHDWDVSFHWDNQYLHWLVEVVAPEYDTVFGIPIIRPRLNFGYSFKYHVPIIDLIGGRLWNTLQLSIAAMVLSWCLAIPIGIYSAVHPYSRMDKMFSFCAFVGMSVPSFFLAFLLLYLASVTGWFPIGGLQSIDYHSLSFLDKLWDRIHHLMIPTFVLGTGSMAGLVRLMRGNMLETLRAEFVTTARAKGLAEQVVIYKHALRNAINPFITIFGYQFSTIFSGAAITEIITAWPGLGRLMLDAVISQDLFLVMGNLLMGSVLLIAGNLTADILLAVSDPRIRHE